MTYDEKVIEAKKEGFLSKDQTSNVSRRKTVPVVEITPPKPQDNDNNEKRKIIDTSTQQQLSQ